MTQPNTPQPVEAPSVRSGPGTVQHRFNALLGELEKRFPDPEPWSASAPEPRYLKALDAALASQPAQAETVEWRDHVEQRLHSWRRSFMNESGDQLALDDFMDKQSLDDLIDYVCSEYEGPSTPPQAQPAPVTCVGCEGTPSAENSPCGVCGAQPAPVAVDDDAVAMAWNTVRAEARALGGATGLGQLLAAVEEYGNRRAALSARSGQAGHGVEPAAKVVVKSGYWSGGHFHDREQTLIRPLRYDLPDGTLLFAHPPAAPALVQLTDEQALAAWKATWSPNEAPAAFAPKFARAILERAHGINGLTVGGDGGEG